MIKKTYIYDGKIVDRKTFYKELEFNMSMEENSDWENLKEAKQFFDTVGNLKGDEIIISDIANEKRFVTILERV